QALREIARLCHLSTSQFSACLASNPPAPVYQHWSRVLDWLCRIPRIEQGVRQGPVAPIWGKPEAIPWKPGQDGAPSSENFARISGAGCFTRGRRFRVGGAGNQLLGVPADGRDGGNERIASWRRRTCLSSWGRLQPCPTKTAQRG